jgi:undecaprenyl-diphosphatase
VIAAALALLWRRPAVLLAVLAADVVADLSAYGLKAAIPRERPPLRNPEPRPLVHVPHTASFPSGHAATSFACAAVIAWISPRLAAPCLLLAAAVGFSRVYVGVHYPLDVVGGAALGLGIALLVRVTALRLPAAGLPRSARGRTAG